jgi:hypothetical protein
LSDYLTKNSSVFVFFLTKNENALSTSMENQKNIDFEYYTDIFKRERSFAFIKAELKEKGLNEEEILNVIAVIDRQLLTQTRKKAENSELIYYFVGGAFVALFGLVVCLNTNSFSIGRVVSYLLMLFGVFAIFIGSNKRRK